MWLIILGQEEVQRHDSILISSGLSFQKDRGGSNEEDVFSSLFSSLSSSRAPGVTFMHDKRIEVNVSLHLCLHFAQGDGWSWCYLLLLIFSVTVKFIVICIDTYSLNCIHFLL